MRSSRMRATTSLELPPANGMITVIGRLGYSCAEAARGPSGGGVRGRRRRVRQGYVCGIGSHDGGTVPLSLVERSGSAEFGRALSVGCLDAFAEVVGLTQPAVAVAPGLDRDRERGVLGVV